MHSMLPEISLSNNDDRADEGIKDPSSDVTWLELKVFHVVHGLLECLSNLYRTAQDFLEVVVLIIHSKLYRNGQDFRKPKRTVIRKNSLLALILPAIVVLLLLNAHVVYLVNRWFCDSVPGARCQREKRSSCHSILGANCHQVTRGGVQSSPRWMREYEQEPPLVSLVVLTLDKAQLLENLLESVAKQKTDFNIEVIVADNGCSAATEKIVTACFSKFHFLGDPTKSYSYVPICNNPGFALGNNRAVTEGWVNPKSKYLLFLNDDLTLHDGFVRHLVETGEAKPKAGAVGCMILNEKGTEVLEAGSIVWSDASCAGYGRGRAIDDIGSDLSYARPVDFISGACLLIHSDIFKDYGGFQHELFPNYYEDSDLQFHVQHDLGREVWFQPLAKVNHHEHGSFGKSDSVAWQKKASKIFRTKWQYALEREHLAPPKTEQILPILLERGRDTRFRKNGRSKILYIDERLPNPFQGSGFARSYDNVKMISDLGHFVTVTALDDPSQWCVDECIRNLENGIGVEIVRPGQQSLESLMMARLGFYDTVIISRPGTFGGARKILQKMYRMSPFVLVFDTEALMFRRDEAFLESSVSLRNPSPSTTFMTNNTSQTTQRTIQRAVSYTKDWEVGLLGMADVVVTVSDRETRMVRKLSGCGHGRNQCKFTDAIHTIGHVMESDAPTKNMFGARKGIAFIGAFHERMYYNGDAIWYFVQEIYPLVVKESKGSIPLTIAGRKIPKALRDSVEKNDLISSHVTFLESPPDLTKLYSEFRLVLAPHLYGAGIQYKLSEAFSLGVPVVMSASTAENFGIKPSDEIGCVGTSVTSFKQCVIEVHSDRAKWERLRKNGIDFVNRTHNRKTMLEEWSKIMTHAMKIRQVLPRCDVAMEFVECSRKPAEGMCPLGEEGYKAAFPDVGQAVTDGAFASAWEHFDKFGKAEGRDYSCCEPICDFDEMAEAMCAAGEAAYIESFPDVGVAVAAGAFGSAWEHFDRFGRAEGRTYSCCQPKECDYEKESRLFTSDPLPRLGEICNLTLPEQTTSEGSEIIPSVEVCAYLQNTFCGV